MLLTDRDADLPGPEEDFMRRIADLMVLLKQDAMETAVRFAKCCGRDEAQDVDVIVALKYEAHEFLKQEGLLERYLALMQDEDEREGDRQDGEDGEQEEDEQEGESGEDTEEGEEEEEEETEEEGGARTSDPPNPPDGCSSYYKNLFQLRDLDDKDFHERAMRYVLTWPSWTPQDPVYALLKQSVNSTVERFGLQHI